MKILITLIILAGQLDGVKGEAKNDTTNYPVIGRHCPDFLLRNIRYYEKKQAALNDFKGKWLILDFWNKNCGACVLSFPKVSAEQKQFGSRAQFIMVGIQDKEGQIEPMFKRFKEKEHLIMPCAFDSVLAKRWDIYTAPYIIVIDPEGVVKAITGALHPEDLQELLSGGTPNLARAHRVHEDVPDDKIPFDPQKPFLTNGNGGNDTTVLYRSLLSKFGKNQRYSYPDSIYDADNKGKFQVLGAPLIFLYNYAFFGTRFPGDGYSIKPVLEMKDSSLFQWSPNNTKNFFCYSLTVPQAVASTDRLLHIMQKDLENYFGFSAVIQERAYPSWKLVATNNAKRVLRSKGSKPAFETIIPKVEYRWTNRPFAEFVSYITETTNLDIVDQTGITGNVDVHVNAVSTDIEDVKKDLRTKGLDLVPSRTVKKVVVIKDIKPALAF